MSYNTFQYHILFEDKAHYNFIRGWLIKKGVNPRKISPYTLPGPRNECASACVINEFPEKLQFISNNYNRVKRILIVAIDADNKSVVQRINILNDAYKKYNNITATLPQDFFKTNADPVFFVIPKWSIDTWARYLLGPTALNANNESQSCKNEYKNSKFTELGSVLADLQNFPNAPSSLKETISFLKSKLKLLGFH